MSFLTNLKRWWNTKPTKLILIKPPSGIVGQTAIVIGTLVRKRNMTPISNANVSVTVTPPSGTSTTVVKVTDSTGKFTVSIPLTLVGTYGVKADYLGVANQYEAASAMTSITSLAKAVATTLTLTPSSLTGTVGDTITISAILQAP